MRFIIFLLIISTSATAQSLWPNVDNAPTLAIASNTKKICKPRLHISKVALFGYRPFTAQRIGRFALSAGAGVMAGLGEAYHKDPTTYERKWGLSPTSWWGSEQWQRQYDKDGRHKNELFNSFRDLHHCNNLVQKTAGAAVYLSIGLSGRREKWYVVLMDAAANFAVHSFSKALTYGKMVNQKPFTW